MDLLRRIRWANVARAAALVAAVMLIVAWPHLRSEPPTLPAAPAVASEPGAEFGVVPPAEDRGAAPEVGAPIAGDVQARESGGTRSTPDAERPWRAADRRARRHGPRRGTRPRAPERRRSRRALDRRAQRRSAKRRGSASAVTTRRRGGTATQGGGAVPNARTPTAPPPAPAWQPPPPASEFGLE